MRWEPFEPRSPNAGAGHSADAAKKAVSPGLEWRSWRTTGSQSRESFTLGLNSASPSNTQGRSRMHKGARTDPCGGRGATRAPTATLKEIGPPGTVHTHGYKAKGRGDNFHRLANPRSEWFELC